MNALRLQRFPCLIFSAFVIRIGLATVSIAVREGEESTELPRYV